MYTKIRVAFVLPEIPVATEVALNLLSILQEFSQAGLRVFFKNSARARRFGNPDSF